MARLTLSEWLARAESDRRFRENTTSITHIPASEGSFAPYPRWVDPLLQKVLTERGITGFTAIRPEPSSWCTRARTSSSSRPRRAARPSATTSPCSRRSSRSPETQGHLPLPHKGPCQRPDDGSSPPHRRAEGGHQDLHLRRRHAGRRQAGDPQAGPRGRHATRTCSTRASCRTTPSGRSSFPT